ncbi:iron-containing alcohol dehydrogenase [Aliidiomarina soli]|uniref:Alcohol dehydrogenase n=1 Tax=Aliidiomarina soli TaxID=1928574 RepID=A0A432WHQ6_9GAMM|nr:iron-containing alcohol dehydrogenase [Aliidiomarina soli]RUO33352.1 alcohol dehydrogenase [Aliidiomarina soli]
MKAALRQWPLRAYMRVFKGVIKILPFRWPTVHEGENATSTLIDEIADAGYQRILLVTDQGVQKLGLTNLVREAAEARNLQLSIYANITSDPTIELITTAVEDVRDLNAEAIIAVGGGSVLDAAKMIGALLKTKKPIIKLVGLFKVRKGMLPLYAVPTTAGTGSEATVAAVVSDPRKMRKLSILDLKLMPTAVALDPAMTMGLPPAITAATGLDALTHAIEAYLSRNALLRTDELALQAARLINSWLPKAYAKGDNLEARQQMAKAAMYAGQAFTQAGVGYVHAIAHNLGARYHIPHGLANAMLLPTVLEFSKPDCSRRMADLSRAMGLNSADGRSDDTALAEALIERVRQLNQRFAIPDYIEQLREEDIASIIRAARSEARFTYAVPRYINQQQGEALLRSLLPNSASNDAANTATEDATTDSA